VRRLLVSSATAIVLIAAVVAVIAYSAVSGKHLRAPEQGQPSSVPGSALRWSRLPGQDYEVLFAAGGRLVVAGGPASDGLCRSALVSPGSLKLRASQVGACDDPKLFYRRVLPLEDAVAGAVNASTFRVSLAGTGGSWREGPVIARWTQLTGTAPVTTYGPGYLWAYLPLSSSGGQLLAISESSGAVLLRQKVPEAMSPLLLAQGDGLWFEAGRSLGPHFQPGLYHLSLAQPKPALVLKASGARWLAGRGNKVFFATESRLYVLAPGKVQQLPLSAPSAVAGPLLAGTSVGPLLAGAATGYVPGPGGALWAVVGSGCARALGEIDPASATYRAVENLPSLQGCASPAGGAAAGATLSAAGRDLYFLVAGGLTGFSYLYRLEV